MDKKIFYIITNNHEDAVEFGWTREEIEAKKKRLEEEWPYEGPYEIRKGRMFEEG